MPVVPPFKTDSYLQYEELSQYLHTLEEAVPHLVKVYSIGASPAGRPLLVAEITNHGTGSASRKASIWIDGNSRGRDLASSAACLAILQRLASEHGRDETITDFVDRYAFYIMPRVCPDEADEYLLNGGGALEARSGITPHDIDGNGRILQMRQRHPLGEWKECPEDQRLLIPRLPEDREGVFYHLYREGVYTEENREKAAVRRSEFQARLDFLRSVKNISFALSLGTSGEGVILSGLAEKSGTDRDLWKAVGQRLASIAGTPCLERDNCCDEWSDTLYKEQGLLAFSANLWSFPRLMGLTETDPFAPQGQLMALQWLDREVGGAGFVPWNSFNHPQLGSVDIGGWDLLQTWYNPPVGALLEAYCQVHISLALGLAELLPCLSFSNFSDEIVGWSENSEPDSEELIPLRRISVELSNSGYLPTWITSRAKEFGGSLQVALDFPEGSKLLSGETGKRNDFLSGLITAHLGKEGNSVFCAAAAEQRSVKMSWIVSGEGSVVITAEQPRAGLAAYASPSAKKSVKTAPVYQSVQSEADKIPPLSAERPALSLSAVQVLPTASAQQAEPVKEDSAEAAAAPLTLPKSSRTLGHHTVTRGELAANSVAAQARNISLLKGMTKIGGSKESREEPPAAPGSSVSAENAASEMLSGSKNVVRPVNLISKSSSGESEGLTPAPEPKIPAAGEPRSAMSGYRPAKLPPLRLSSVEKTPSLSASSGEYRAALEGEKAAVPRTLIRSDSPLRKEQPAGPTGRVFGQGSTKGGSVMETPSPAVSALPRAALGRPVGQTDLERRQFDRERSAVDVAKFEGHEIKPHSLLAPKKKTESEEEKAPEPPPAPSIPTGPVTAQLLRRPKDNE